MTKQQEPTNQISLEKLEVIKTSKVTNRLCVVAALCLLSSVAAFAQKTNVDWDRQADFIKFKTYAWEKSPHPAAGLWDQRMIDGVDKQLAAKGFTKVDSKPDLSVVYSNSVSDQKQVVGTGYGMGPGFGWGWGWGRGIRTVQYNTYITKEGTLLLELADANSHQLMWRGSAMAAISESSDKNIKTLNSALTKLFKS
jgi:uncharacterized protein DUF4136